MKHRIGLVTFLALAFSTTIVIFIAFHFFDNERLRLIDSQIDVISTSLLEEGLDPLSTEHLANKLAQLSPRERLLAVVRVVTSDGDILFENRTATVLLGDIKVPRVAKRMTLDTTNHEIRLANFRSPTGLFYLQVGILLDHGQIHWDKSQRHLLILASIVVLLLFATTVVATRFMFRPVRILADYLNHYSRALSEFEKHPPVPARLLKLERRSHLRDELTDLIRSVIGLRKQLEMQFRLNDQTVRHMTHELRTPLTVIQNALEFLGTTITDSKNGEMIRTSLEEIGNLNRTITEFLQWSKAMHELRSAADTFAIHLSESVEKLKLRFSPLYRDRLIFETQSDDTVFCHPQLWEQLMSNLVENAIKYSPQDSSVIIRSGRGFFSVVDRGPGIPAEVLERLGQPFNRGSEGTGLGLAWVHGICEAYGFKLASVKTRETHEVSVKWIAS